jgi:hypothetical protein
MSIKVEMKGKGIISLENLLQMRRFDVSASAVFVSS